MKTLHARIRLSSMRRPRLALALQVLALSLFCFACDMLARRLHLPLPGSVLALGLLLALLGLRVVPLAALRRGADWLLAEMLLFFIPAVMAVSHHMDLLRTEGVMFVRQTDAALEAVRTALAPLDPLALTAMHVATTLTGSAVLALALLHGRLTAEEAWAAAHVDEDWNIAQWGADAEAMARRAKRFEEFRAAALVLDLSSRR